MLGDDIATTDIDLSHHIQRQVIMALRQKGEQSYQALKPDGVEGNAFNYHLRILKKIGFIRSSGEKYTLTPKGLLVSDGFSSPVARLMLRPYAHMATLVTSGDKLLLYRASRQPLQNIYCLASGKMRYGDTLSESLARELRRREVTGEYTAQFLCQTNVRYTQQSEVVIHRPGVIWHVEYTGELRTSQTPNGRSEWCDIAALGELQHVSPEVTEALRRLADDSCEPIDASYEIV